LVHSIIILISNIFLPVQSLERTSIQREKEREKEEAKQERALMSDLRKKQKHITLEDLDKKIQVQQPTTPSLGTQLPFTPEKPKQHTTQNISSSSEDDEYTCSNDSEKKDHWEKNHD